MIVYTIFSLVESVRQANAVVAVEHLRKDDSQHETSPNG